MQMAMLCALSVLCQDTDTFRMLQKKHIPLLHWFCSDVVVVVVVVEGKQKKCGGVGGGKQ